MSGHTSGPWLIQDDGHGEWSVWTRQPHTGKLADIRSEDINGEYPAKANALLMRAALDLLAALEALDPYLDAIVCYASTMDEHEPNRLVFNARAAIAKAKDEA